MKKKIFLSLLVFILVGASSGTAYYYYTKYQTAQESLANPEVAAQEEVSAIINKLGELIALPQDEEPTLATVLDQESLLDQPFFANSQNGDKVVIYTKARKAILYRPSEHKIIEVAPIEISQPEEVQELPEPELEPEVIDELIPEEPTETPTSE